MRLTTHYLKTLPFVLLLPWAMQANAAGGSLELDQPAPSMGEDLCVAGECAGAGETVQFKFKQNDKVQKLSSTAKVPDKNKEGLFNALIDMSNVKAESGPATLMAKCSGGKKLDVDFSIGVKSSTAGSKTSVAAETDEASANSERSRGRGHNQGELEISEKTPAKVGGKVLVSGKCPSTDGEVSFSMEQNNKTKKFGKSALAGNIRFSKNLDLSEVQAKQGPAKLVASCPGGKLLTMDITIDK